jgi:hypothetical protein
MLGHILVMKNVLKGFYDNNLGMPWLVITTRESNDELI